MESDNHESRDVRITVDPKRTRQTTTTIETLPEEIILRILSKLPLSSLVRFRCVCKAWKALSQDQCIADRYTNNRQCLMVYSHDNPVKDRLCFIEFNSNRIDEDTSVKEIRVPFGSSALKLNVLGSCNGLLCLSDPNHNDQYVYNPFTSEYRELPKTNHSSIHWAVFGFGFHPKTNEYKVVKFIYFNSSQQIPQSFTGESKVQVFTLGGTWRNLGSAKHILQNSIGKNVLVNGRLHFLTKVKYRQESDIVSFDLEDEQFRPVAKLDSVRIGSSDYLLVLNGCLSVASNARSVNDLEIWVQKEYDVESSWVKTYTINVSSYVPRDLQDRVDEFPYNFYHPRKFDRVLCGLSHGEILLVYKSKALVVYDPKRESFKDVVFEGMPKLFHTVFHLGNFNRIDAIVGSNS